MPKVNGERRRIFIGMEERYSIISIRSFEKCEKKGKHSANYSQSAFPSSFQLGCHIVAKGGDLFLFQSVGHIDIDIHRRRYISVSQNTLNEFQEPKLPWKPSCQSPAAS